MCQGKKNTESDVGKGSKKNIFMIFTATTGVILFFQAFAAN
jgi:hypothetical protein